MSTDREWDIFKWTEDLADKYDVSTDLVSDLFEVQYKEAGPIETRKQCTENFLKRYFEEQVLKTPVA